MKPSERSRHLVFSVLARSPRLPGSRSACGISVSESSASLADCGEATMEAFGMSTIATAPSSITCSIDSRTWTRRNGATPPSSSSTQFCHSAQEERKFLAVSENVSGVEVRGHLSTISSNLALASLVSGFANAKSAFAISYDEVVGAAEEAASSSTDTISFDLPEVDTSALTDFLSSNPLALLGGGAIIALPFIFSAIFKKPEGYGTVSAKQAFEKLGDKVLKSQLLDIRDADGVKEGKPDLKVFKKKVTQLPYDSELEGYVAKVLKQFKDAEDTTIYVLDRFDGDSLSVAKLLANGGFKAAYAVKDGAEGPSGWQNSELPWLVPAKFSLGSFKELLSASDTGNILPATLGVAAAAGVGLVVFSEAETALQLLGSAALVQLFVKKFLFAADRKATIEELKTFLDTKVAPKEFVDELKEIADVILPKYEEAKQASVNGAAVVENTIADVAAETVVSVEEKTSILSSEIADVAAETAASVEENTSIVSSEIADVAAETAASVEDKTTTPTEPKDEEKQEVKETESSLTSSTELPRTFRPLSPYAQYPGLKPPSSPTPSRP